MLSSELRAYVSDPHADAVAHWARITAEQLGLSAAHTERVVLAARVHDIGKVLVPRTILEKPGRLDPSEWEVVRRHPEHGARLLSDPIFDDIRPWVLFHHERPDGRGYPYGLADPDIPLEAAVIAVADAWSAMTADRVYRRRLRACDAADELRDGAGTQFHGRAAHALLRALRSAVGDVRPPAPSAGPRLPRGAARARRAA